MNRPKTFVQDQPRSSMSTHAPSLLRIRVLIELAGGIYVARCLDTILTISGEELSDLRMRCVNLLEEQLFKVARKRSTGPTFVTRVDTTLSRKWYQAATHQKTAVVLRSEASAVVVFALARAPFTGTGRTRRKAKTSP